MSETLFVPKYQKIINDIRGQIGSGQLQPGEKLPCREEIVRHYGVTRATVNHAMGELLRAGVLWATPHKGTYVAEKAAPVPVQDKVAIVVQNDLLMQHVIDWNSARNYYSMFGRLISLIPKERQEIVNLIEAREHPEKLKHFRKILWNNLTREEFEKAVDAVGDRRRFFLLNRYYPDCDFVSINHRRAAFDLAERFLRYLSPEAPVAMLDMPYGENLSNRFVWLERRAGFVDACEKYHHFYRILEMRQDHYEFNQEQFRALDELRKDGECGLILSPSQDLVGAFLGFLHARQYQLGREYLYGDFDNVDSLKNFGLKIPSVVQDYRRLAEMAAEHLWTAECRLFVDHQIVNCGAECTRAH